MRFLRKSALLILAVLPPTVTTLGADAAGSKSTFIRVERFPTISQTGDLSPTAVQGMARAIGCGRFLIRNSQLKNDKTAAGARVYFVFSSAEALEHLDPMMRLFYKEDSESEQVWSGSPEKIAQELFKERTQHVWDSNQVNVLLPDILIETLYNGEGTLESGSVSAVPISFEKLKDDRAETVEPRPAYSAEFQQANSIIFYWEGTFQLSAGGKQNVAVVLSSTSQAVVSIYRSKIFFAPKVGVPTSSRPGESWFIAEPTGWRPTRRYLLKMTFASLRHDPQQRFELGKALLQEKDDLATAEAIKWLKLSAADGYQDATDFLSLLSSGALRSSRERDISRKER